MLALVLSDSHGNIALMKEAVDLSGPDVILFLGDCWHDADKLEAAYPDIPLYRVPGNCDVDVNASRELELDLEGHKVYLCHGDRYGVDISLGGLSMLASERTMEILLYGHTHVPYCDWHGSTLFLNPGSIALPRGTSKRSYAVLFLMDGLRPRAWLKELE